MQLNNDLAFLIGTPLLPIPGKSYYRQYDFIIQLGSEVKLSLLQDALNNKLNPAYAHWVVWQENQTYSLIKKDAFVQLSRSSFLRTKEKLAE